MKQHSGSVKAACGRSPEVRCCSSTFRNITDCLGNYYSIENDYDEEAKIFFAQGSEEIEKVAQS
jgi:hypothetical protein